MSVCVTDPATVRVTDRASTSASTSASTGPEAELLVHDPAGHRAGAPAGDVVRRSPVTVAPAGVLRPVRRPGLRGRLRRLVAAPQAGMSTAEYAVGMLAACGFAGLLLKVLTSSTVSGLLTGLVKRALTLVG